MARALAALIAVAAAAAMQSARSDAASTFDPNVPRQVHLAFTEEPGGLLFSWVTGTPNWAGQLPRGAPLPTVQLGTAPGVYSLNAAGNYSVQYNNTGDIIHRVNVTSLAWSTRYYYIVGDASIDVYSSEWSFTTPAAPGAEAPASFLAYGDMGYWSGSSTIVQADLLRELAQNGPYDAVLHVVSAAALRLAAMWLLLRNTRTASVPQLSPPPRCGHALSAERSSYCRATSLMPGSKVLAT